MSILFVAQNRNMAPFKEALLALDPNLDVEIWPGVQHPERVNFAVSWNHPRNVLQQFPNLKVISSLGAGVDHLLKDDTLPKHVAFTRIAVPSLSDQMCDYVLAAVLNLLRRTGNYLEQQRRGEWNPLPPHSKKELMIGVMGLGEIGQNVALSLYKNGFRVSGWSVSKKEIPGVKTWTEKELKPFLQSVNVLVCLLPLTPQTEGILDLTLFKQLRNPAFLIHAARGKHLVEEDLIYALDTGLLEHAVLDVFPQEPLPESHPFWGRKKITITPHIASLTYPEDVAELLLENYKRLLSGMELLYTVDQEKGY